MPTASGTQNEGSYVVSSAPEGERARTRSASTRGVFSLAVLHIREPADWKGLLRVRLQVEPCPLRPQPHGGEASERAAVEVSAWVGRGSWPHQGLHPLCFSRTGLLKISLSKMRTWPLSLRSPLIIYSFSQSFSKYVLLWMLGL